MQARRDGWMDGWMDGLISMFHLCLRSKHDCPLLVSYNITTSAITSIPEWLGIGLRHQVSRFRTTELAALGHQGMSSRFVVLKILKFWMHGGQ